MSTPELQEGTNPWTLDAETLGEVLTDLLEGVGMTRKEVATKIAPGVETKHKVVGRWLLGSGLAVDQMATLIGLLANAPAAERKRALDRLGLGHIVLPVEKDRELQRRLDLAREAYRADSKLARSAWSHLETVLSEEAGGEEANVAVGGGGPGSREERAATGS